MQSIYYYKPISAPAWIILCLYFVLPLRAEIITDGTTGSAQTLVGPDFTIPEILGTRTGANLFHSFEQFNIASGEQATFTGSSNIANVISRVTGGETSTINGLLRSEVGQAAFYFINPSGVVFGTGAQIDVPASFYVSTANELRFADGSTFNTSQLPVSTWSMDEPKSFGFLDDQTATIHVANSELILTPGNTFSLTGGELQIDNALLLAEQGEIQLVATGDIDTTATIEGNVLETAQGNLNINDSKVDVTGSGAGHIVIQSGNSEINSSIISADNNGVIEANLNQGINIYATSLHITNSQITTDTFGQGQKSANISVIVKNDLNITNDGLVGSRTFTSGDAGNVTVNASQLLIDKQEGTQLTGIFSDTAGSGNAGYISLEIEDTLKIWRGGLIRSDVFSAGNSGFVSVNAGDIEIKGESLSNISGITSDSHSNSTGHSGNVLVTAQDDLTLINGGIISSSSYGSGNTGKIVVSAENIRINAGPPISRRDGTFEEILSFRQTGIFNDSRSLFSGPAGNVLVTVKDQLSITSGGVIRSDTFSESQSGTVTIQSENISLADIAIISSSSHSTGNAGTVTVRANNLSLSNAGKILNESLSSGHAGKVDIVVNGKLLINSGGLIRTGAHAEGAAGLIAVTADQMIIDGHGERFLTGIFSDARIGSSGAAGSINIRVSGNIVIINSGEIQASTFASGNTNEISIHSGNIIIDGEEGMYSTGIFSESITDSTGDAGKIDLTVADNLLILNGSEISSNTISEGNAGSIEIKSGQIIIDDQYSPFFTGISSNSKGNTSGQVGSLDLEANTLSIYNGGKISIESDSDVVITTNPKTEINLNVKAISLTNSAVTTQSSGSAPAGSVTLIEVDTLSLNASTISTEANNASGGDITAQANIIDMQNSQMTTSVSGQGNGGDIILDSDVLILDGGFIQANTAGTDNSRGGDIEINIDALITSRNTLQTAGIAPLDVQPGINVIQAAAPEGTPGDINITSPQLNISGDLASLKSNLLDIDPIAQNPCIAPDAKQSTLVSLGHGGLPESPEQAGNITLDLDRLQQLLPHSPPIPNSSSDTPNFEAAQQLAWQAITECQP